MLEKYHKQFIIWGNNNAITYKEIFPLIKEGKLWLSYCVKGKSTLIRVLFINAQG